MHSQQDTIVDVDELDQLIRTAVAKIKQIRVSKQNKQKHKIRKKDAIM
jgi:hypothetical protein